MRQYWLWATVKEAEETLFSLLPCRGQWSIHRQYQLERPWPHLSPKVQQGLPQYSLASAVFPACPCYASIFPRASAYSWFIYLNSTSNSWSPGKTGPRGYKWQSLSFGIMLAEQWLTCARAWTRAPWSPGCGKLEVSWGSSTSLSLTFFLCIFLGSTVHIGFADKLISSSETSVSFVVFTQRLFLHLVSWYSENRVTLCFLPCLTKAAPSSVCHMSEGRERLCIRDQPSSTLMLESSLLHWRWSIPTHHSQPQPNP